MVDEIIAEEFSSPDLELVWLDEDTDAAQAEAQFESRVKLGVVTLNELRDSLGLDPFDNTAADRPMVLTATGYVPIEANAGGVGANPQAPPVVQKYSPDQLRVPGGNPDGGQWTSLDNGGSTDSSTSLDAAPTDLPDRRRHYVALETETLTDATENGTSNSSWPSKDH
jgi:hypothetical protein